MQCSPLTKNKFSYTSLGLSWRFVCVRKFLPQNAKPGRKKSSILEKFRANWNCEHPYFFLSEMFQLSGKK